MEWNRNKKNICPPNVTRLQVNINKGVINGILTYLLWIIDIEFYMQNKVSTFYIKSIKDFDCYILSLPFFFVVLIHSRHFSYEIELDGEKNIYEYTEVRKLVIKTKDRPFRIFLFESYKPFVLHMRPRKLIEEGGSIYIIFSSIFSFIGRWQQSVLIYGA